MQQQREETGGNIIKDILFVVRRNIIIILVCLFLGGACGYGYSLIKKPNYVASANVTYVAGQISSNGSVSSGGASEINIMRAYINTILDFCDEGVVVDRANFYYVQYKNAVYENEQQGKEYSFFDFIDFIQSEDPYKAPSNVAEEDRNHIVSEKVSTSISVASTNEDEYFFSIKYTDEEEYEAKIKCRLVIEALKKELEQIDSGKNQYFDVIHNKIIPLYEGKWLPSTSSDISKKKFMLAGVAIGAVIAAAIAYVRTMLDNSVTTKEMLEELSGVSVLTVIKKEGGDKDGK